MTRIRRAADHENIRTIIRSLNVIKLSLNQWFKDSLMLIQGTLYDPFHAVYISIRDLRTPVRRLKTHVRVIGFQAVSE